MSVWLCTPSARPAAEANKMLSFWRRQGYKIALWRDRADDAAELIADHVNIGTYPGHPAATNHLIHNVLWNDPNCDWVVNAGDDTQPDLAFTADEIAKQCNAHFTGDYFEHNQSKVVHDQIRTFGVMQPTGDRYAQGCIDRICGSPWIGRNFAKRIYRGKGPFWPEFYHMFADEHLQRVAQKLGILWQRRDLIHLHNHFMRVSPSIDSDAVGVIPPPHLTYVNTPKHWEDSKAIFQRLEAAGFKEAEDLLP